MNQRIRELAEQARQDYLKHHWPTGLSADRVGMYPQLMERFAELIVKECVGVVDSMADPEDSERYFWAIQNASQKIKQHFGVEQ